MTEKPVEKIQIEGIIKSGETSLARVLNTLPDILDVRLANHFKNVKYPTHEYALFILRELIERPGPLISEELLSARLGIDRDNSPDWIKLGNIAGVPVPNNIYEILSSDEFESIELDFIKRNRANS